MQIYGYCRISTPTQNIDRQIRNIKAAFPDAHIVQEVYLKRQELHHIRFVDVMQFFVLLSGNHCRIVGTVGIVITVVTIATVVIVVAFGARNNHLTPTTTITF